MNKEKILRLLDQIEMIINTVCNTGYTLQPGDEDAILNRVKAIMDEVSASPKSNGDHVRQMTDGKLANKLIDKCTICTYHNAECETKFCICGEGILKWLQEEESGNDT